MESHDLSNSVQERLEKSERISASMREHVINQCVVGSLTLMGLLGIFSWDQGSMDNLAHQMQGLPFTTPDPKSASSLRRAERVAGSVVVKSHFEKVEGLWRLQMKVRAKGAAPTAILLNARDDIVLTVYGDKDGLVWEGLYDVEHKPVMAVILNERGEKLGMEVLQK